MPFTRIITDASVGWGERKALVNVGMLGSLEVQADSVRVSLCFQKQFSVSTDIIYAAISHRLYCSVYTEGEPY